MNQTLFEQLVHHLCTREASVTIVYGGEEFSIASEWSQEAPDSPMAAAAAFGSGGTFEEAIENFLIDAGPVPEESDVPCPTPWITNCRAVLSGETGQYCQRVCRRKLERDAVVRIGEPSVHYRRFADSHAASGEPLTDVLADVNCGWCIARGDDD